MATVTAPGNGVQAFGYTAANAKQLPMIVTDNGDGTGTLNTSTTATISGNVTVVQPTGTNLHTVVDSGAITATLGAGAATIGALTANQSVNVAQIAGTNTVTAAAGVIKTGVVGNAGAIFDGATATAVPANALLDGARGATANPAAVTDGQMVALRADKTGRLVTVASQNRDLVGVQQTPLAASSETTFITAGAAGVFNDITSLVVTTAGIVAATLTIKDATAGTTRLIINYPNAASAPATPLVLNFNPPLPQAVAANNWTVTNSVTTATNITAVFAKNI